MAAFFITKGKNMLRRYDKVFDIFETLKKSNVEILIVYKNKQIEIIKKDKTIEKYSVILFIILCLIF